LIAIVMTISHHEMKRGEIQKGKDCEITGLTRISKALTRMNLNLI